MPKPSWVPNIARTQIVHEGVTYNYGDVVSDVVARAFPNAVWGKEYSASEIEALPEARLKELLEWKQEKPHKRLGARIIKKEGT